MDPVTHSAIENGRDNQLEYLGTPANQHIDSMIENGREYNIDDNLLEMETTAQNKLRTFEDSDVVDIISSLEETYGTSTICPASEDILTQVNSNTNKYFLPYLNFLSEPSFSSSGVFDKTLWDTPLHNDFDNTVNCDLDFWKYNDSPIVECLGQSCLLPDLSTIPDIPWEDYFKGPSDIDVAKVCNNEIENIIIPTYSKSSKTESPSSEDIHQIMPNADVPPLSKDTYEKNTGELINYEESLSRNNYIIHNEITIPLENNNSHASKNITIEKNEEVKLIHQKEDQIENIDTTPHKTYQSIPQIISQQSNTIRHKKNEEAEISCMNRKPIKYRTILPSTLKTKDNYILIENVTNPSGINRATKTNRYLAKTALEQVNATPYQVIKAGNGLEYETASRDPLLVRAAEYYSRNEPNTVDTCTNYVSSKRATPPQPGTSNINDKDIQVNNNNRYYLGLNSSSKFSAVCGQSYNLDQSINEKKPIEQLSALVNSITPLTDTIDILQNAEITLSDDIPVHNQNVAEYALPTQSNFTDNPTLSNHYMIRSSPITITALTPIQTQAEISHSNDLNYINPTSNSGYNISLPSTNILPQVTVFQTPSMNSSTYVNKTMKARIINTEEANNIQLNKTFFENILASSPLDASTVQEKRVMDPCFISSDSIEVYQTVHTPVQSNTKSRDEEAKPRKRGRPRKKPLDTLGYLNRSTNSQTKFRKILPRIPLSQLQKDDLIEKQETTLVNDSIKFITKNKPVIIVKKSDVPNLTPTTGTISPYLCNPNVKYRKVHLAQTAEQKYIASQWLNCHPRKRHRGTKADYPHENNQPKKIAKNYNQVNQFNGIQAAIRCVIPPKIPIEMVGRNNL